MVLLRFKLGVLVEKLDTQLLPGLLALCHFMETILGVREVWITSVNDGVHKPGSLHAEGRAVDIRCKQYVASQVEQVVAEFKSFYDADYDLIWENRGLPNEHLHCEYDPENRNH